MPHVLGKEHHEVKIISKCLPIANIKNNPLEGTLSCREIAVPLGLSRLVHRDGSQHLPIELLVRTYARSFVIKTMECNG